MSAASTKGIPAVRKKLAELAKGLREAASGEVTKRAAEKVRAQIDHVARAKLERHKYKGDALAALDVSAEGSRVIVKVPRYVGMHSWWAFRKGMPGFVLKQASMILASELLAALGRDDARAKVAAELVDEAAEKAAAKAAAKAQRKAERAYNRKVKAQEDRE